MIRKTQLHKKTFGKLTVDELYELLRVRSEVFVVEQNCVYQDMDGDDQQSIAGGVLGKPVIGGEDVHMMFHQLSQEVLKIAAEINGKYIL